MTPKSIDLERETIQTALYAISTRHQGVLNPHDVVDAARHEDNPLHRYFEWDDNAAAEAYRLAQAAGLIRRVKLTILRSDANTRTVKVSTTRGFQSRPSMRHAEGGYEPVDHIYADPDKRRELLARILRDLVAYRERYAELSELQSVWMAVDEVSQDLATEALPSDVPAEGESRPGAAS